MPYSVKGVQRDEVGEARARGRGRGRARGGPCTAHLGLIDHFDRDLIGDLTLEQVRVRVRVRWLGLGLPYRGSHAACWVGIGLGLGVGGAPLEAVG